MICRVDFGIKSSELFCFNNANNIDPHLSLVSASVTYLLFVSASTFLLVLDSLHHVRREKYVCAFESFRCSRSLSESALSFLNFVHLNNSEIQNGRQ